MTKSVKLNGLVAELFTKIQERLTRNSDSLQKHITDHVEFQDKLNAVNQAVATRINQDFERTQKIDSESRARDSQQWDGLVNLRESTGKAFDQVKKDIASLEIQIQRKADKYAPAPPAPRRRHIIADTLRDSAVIGKGWQVEYLADLVDNKLRDAGL
jgi:HD-GYP domain-containing protein (c-di-GMP phosphodiesterase class II)